MLITNTPNSELHIQNNAGEELVTITDESTTIHTKLDNDSTAYPPIVADEYLFGMTSDEIQACLAGTAQSYIISETMPEMPDLNDAPRYIRVKLFMDNPLIAQDAIVWLSSTKGGLSYTTIFHSAALNVMAYIAVFISESDGIVSADVYAATIGGGT